MQVEDEEVSKYYINYISDDSDVLNDNNNQIHCDNGGNDERTLPNSLIITPVPQELFTNQQMRVKKDFS